MSRIRRWWPLLACAGFFALGATTTIILVALRSHSCTYVLEERADYHPETPWTRVTSWRRTALLPSTEGPRTVRSTTHELTRITEECRR